MTRGARGLARDGALADLTFVTIDQLLTDAADMSAEAGASDWTVLNAADANTQLQDQVSTSLSSLSPLYRPLHLFALGFVFLIKTFKTLDSDCASTFPPALAGPSLVRRPLSTAFSIAF